MVEALDIRVRGIVQGVGFRPFVYRMAKKYLISGWVLNAADGVTIHAEGESKLLDEFVMELSDNAPAAAQVTEIDLREVPLEGFDTFEIRFSDEGAVDKTTLVSPELATCDDCVAELFNPNDRRFRYPFINCTNCGPRFTIIDRLPYDRPKTSMKAFPMCERCAAEYADPLDRRFHAQPDACFDCGPHVSWREGAEGDVAWGATREESDAVFAAAVEMLLAGKILAVKGLGGFHLVCDANNPDAVALLRERKRREGKAFAVMAADADAARAVCEVGDAEEAVLAGSARPIVLLRKRAGAVFAAGLADKLPELGVMLPYTPVQHLLMHDFAEARRARAAAGEDAAGAPGTGGEAAGGAAGTSGVPGTPGADAAALAANPPLLVMTSGNLHDEPIVIDDEDAYARLAAVADGFLGNDRPILTRFDDSVVRVIRAGSAGDAVQVIRRARGFAPLPIEVPLVRAAEEARAAAAPDAPASATPDIFATGPEQKNTFALLRGDEAFVSQHIGDMENADVYDAWLAAKARFEGLFEVRPGLIACDLHPEYLTSKWAADQDIPVIRVQHHHAHVVSVMAEHGLADAVCGIAFDGTGYGPDGAIWGGEALLANPSAFERFGNFAYVPMPGGAAAIKHPLRMAYGVLWAFDLLEHPGAAPALDALGAEAAGLCDQMIERGLNTPMTSSVGRLFDAASALLGLCLEPAYEGEGAILLEAALEGRVPSAFADRPRVVPPREADRAAAAARVDEGAAPAARDEAADDLAAAERYAVTVTKNVATEASTAQDTSVVLFDAAPTFTALLDDFATGVPVPVIARRFHDAVASAVVMAAELVRALYGIDVVALSGGVFMNRYLVEKVLAELEAAGFTTAVNRDLPPNDGCISLGQAVVAWAQTTEGSVPAAS
ncbi:carbamoyltransferase HypF [Adlercreutzia faecimuris]|uniref:acylphosphatase n=1 Tax=Adlercreutzia faecimuris TaxID=2897341 RepID=A0ABS9WDC5_9ACTN|nr:carbamoyltransferase HypF [Adlercreutzia sp. JBNU-10]MCI2240843.1 carbamoyltransferase HypF [Adlercreutzia sp. JBNU-10]